MELLATPLLKEAIAPRTVITPHSLQTTKKKPSMPTLRVCFRLLDQQRLLSITATKKRRVFKMILRFIQLKVVVTTGDHFGEIERISLSRAGRDWRHNVAISRERKACESGWDRDDAGDEDRSWLRTGGKRCNLLVSEQHSNAILPLQSIQTLRGIEQELRRRCKCGGYSG